MGGGGERKRDRQTERERERKRETNQCGRFASLYTVHHAKLMAREEDRGRGVSS